MQAKQFREQQRLGLLSQEEFALDTSALSKRKADMAGVAAWPEDNEGPSDDDFDVDAPSQVAFLCRLHHAMVLPWSCLLCLRFGKPFLSVTDFAKSPSRSALPSNRVPDCATPQHRESVTHDIVWYGH